MSHNILECVICSVLDTDIGRIAAMMTQAVKAAVALHSTVIHIVLVRDIKRLYCHTKRTLHQVHFQPQCKYLILTICHPTVGSATRDLEQRPQAVS